MARAEGVVAVGGGGGEFKWKEKGPREKWCESALLEDIPLGALRAVSPLSTQIGVFDFFWASARSKSAF